MLNIVIEKSQEGKYRFIWLEVLWFGIQIGQVYVGFVVVDVGVGVFVSFFSCCLVGYSYLEE